MSKIILQPSGNKDAREHYLDTIKNSVSLRSIKNHINGNDFEILGGIYPSDNCKIWGVTPSGNNITKWNKIEKGDVTLFSKDGRIFASAVTTYKLHSKSLAAELWNYNKKGQTWEYIYFLDEVKYHNIPYKDFNKVVGYADNYIIQGFNVLKPEKSTSVMTAFDLESEIFIKEITEKAFEELLTKLDSLKETETEIMSSRRLEQGYLKRSLFGENTIGTCACCKKEYPISYLVTAHIKKRAFCKPNEKKDINIVMPMCKFGCDELYEKGYISVSNGIFIDMSKTPTSVELQGYIDKITGSKCDFFNDKTRIYFDWHYKQHSL